MQLEIFDKEDWQILLEAEEYFKYLQKPNKAFSDMPVCPFLKAEIETNKLMVEVWRPSEVSLKSLFEKFYSSKYNSALFICMDTPDIKWKDVDRDEYQKTLQKFLKKTEYKALCFSPFEEHTAAGESTRKKSPYFLINVATRKELHISHKKLLDTKYFDKFSDAEKTKLKV